MNKHLLIPAVLLLILFLPILTLGNQNSDFENGIIIESETILDHLDEIPLELIISRRMSIHYGDWYSDADIPWESISKILWAASGHSWQDHTVPSLSDYPSIIYVCNQTAAYKFVSETQSLSLWREGDYRSLGEGYDAPIQLYLAFNTRICQDVHWGYAELGCAIQNIYLMANALNLGTVCQAGTWLNTTYIHQELELPQNEKVVCKMPLGYPISPYTDYQNLNPTFRPSSTELPEIQDSTTSFKDALESISSSYEWSENPISKQELSQILWASYGYSFYEDTASTPPRRHRTVPSAHSYYPLKIYIATSLGVYQYIPEQHTLTPILDEDRRYSIAQASGNPWASSAPLIVAMAWDDSHILTVDTTYVEVGLVTQNVYLESAAWGLIANWGKADTNEEEMKLALGLTGLTNLHPVSIITIGHPSTYIHKAEWKEAIYPVETQTNSTILNFAFDPPNKRIKFDISGPLSSIGFCNVTIPKTLLHGDFTLLLNENPQTILTQDNTTHTSLYFTYRVLSSVNVQIIGEYVIPEFPTFTSILILLSLMFTVLIYNRKKFSKL